MYILIIDPDQFANALVQFVLKKAGYEVETIDNPRGAMQMIQRREPDLLILEANMPYMSGFEFSATLRAEGYVIPLIFLTTRDTIEDKLKGFDVGADDYICKPYNHQELVARVQVIMHRIKKSNKIVNQSIRCGEIELFPSELKVILSSKTVIFLTPTEMQILHMLMIYPGHVIKREQLLEEIWNDTENNSNIVDVYIRRLRTKLKNYPDEPEHILSIRGIGYKFVE